MSAPNLRAQLDALAADFVARVVVAISRATIADLAELQTPAPTVTPPPVKRVKRSASSETKRRRRAPSPKSSRPVSLLFGGRPHSDEEE